MSLDIKAKIAETKATTSKKIADLKAKIAEAKTSGKAKIDSLKAKAPAKAPKVAKASKVVAPKVVAPKVSAPVVAPKTSAKAPKVPGSR